MKGHKFKFYVFFSFGYFNVYHIAKINFYLE